MSDIADHSVRSASAESLPSRRRRKRTWRSRIGFLNSRRGVALILTLGILALLLVLAMSFAFSSLHAQRTTAYSVDLAVSRLQAETALQTVINMMKAELVDTDDYNNFFPGTKIFIDGTGNWTEFDYMVSMVDTANGDTSMTDGLLTAVTHKVNDLVYIPASTPTGQTLDMTSVNATLASNFSWIPLYKDVEIAGNFVDQVDGRYGFVLIDETGKIDPNTAVDDTYAEGNEVAAGFNRGEYLSEVSLLDLGFSSGFSAKLRSANAGGMQPAGAKWYSRYHIARVTDLTGASGQTTLDMMNATLYPYRRPDTISNQKARDSNNTPVTFDLRLTTNGGNMKPSTGSNGDDIFEMINYQSGSHPGISYLRGWQDRGDFQTVADRYYNVSARALNLMANLKDYIDTDRDASRDSDALGANSFPNYWGVEAVPSLSRMLIKVENTTTSVSTGTNSNTVNPSLSFSFRPELMNGFGDLSSYATDARIIVYFLARAQFGTGESYISGVETVDIKKFMNPSNAANDKSATSGVFGPTAVTGNFNANGYYQWTETDASTTGGYTHKVTGTPLTGVNDSQLTSKMGVTAIDIFISRIVVLETDSNNNGYEDEDKWDCVMPCEYRTGFSQFLTPVATLEAPGGDDTRFWTMEAYCPVSNMWPGDWKITGPTTTESGFTGKAMTSWWNDPRTTLYVRDGEMESAAEVGAILRMDPPSLSDTTAAWATLNLIDYYYNGTVHYRSDSDDGIVENYDSLDPSSVYWQDEEGNGGDRNILDYVTIGRNTAERELIGRININTRRPEVLKSLFYRLVGTTYASGETLTKADMDTMVTHIMAKTYPDLTYLADNTKPKRTGPLPLSALNEDGLTAYDPDHAKYLLSNPVRYRNPPLYGLLFQPSDLSPTFSEYQLEHMLVHTMQLVNARHNYFTCVVAAQSIKDTGSIIGVDENDMTVNGVPARMGRWDQGADAILAEQKVRVILYRDARTNKITVERFDYLDE